MLLGTASDGPGVRLHLPLLSSSPLAGGSWRLLVCLGVTPGTSDGGRGSHSGQQSQEEHFSIPLAAVGNSFNAGCPLAMVAHSPEAIDDLAYKGVALGLECRNECALATLCIANDTECLSSGEGEGLFDGFFELCTG